jgi:alpha-beta hydrolase superfamily lysophospholipase
VGYDVLDGYTREDLLLAPDGHEPTVATLVRYDGSPPDADAAMLFVHGFNDYFFQAEFGPRLAAAGYAFYALDLRRYGRSLRPGHSPCFIEDLSTYYEELDAAMRRIRGVDGRKRVVLHGHSTGGLIAALYAHDRAPVNEVDALLLNGPFFDFRGNKRTRWPLKTLVPLIARVAPGTVVSRPNDPLYSKSLHMRRGGRWQFDESWKRPGDLPYTAGFLAACRAGHRRIKGGLDIPCPVLVLHSDRSGGGAKWNDSYRCTDVVLQVEKMVAYTPGLGLRSESLAVVGALHDVFLSREDVADRAWSDTLAWMAKYCPA